MAFVYMHIFSLTFAFRYESFIIECYPVGVSNKHCLLSLFSFVLSSNLVLATEWTKSRNRFM